MLPSQEYSEYDLVYSGLKVDIKSFPVLKGVHGHAVQGRVLAIMGPSGCGKTTLLNTLYGQYKVKEGRIRLGGVALSRETLHKVSYVTQMDLFFGDLTLAETLYFHARLKVNEAVSGKDVRHRVESLVDLLELTSCMDTQIGDITQPKLSSGERKRASIACELLGEPRVLLLDEPTTGLDSTVALKIMNFLHQYAREFKATVVCSVHQPSSKMVYLFEDILLMYAGRTAYQGGLQEALRCLDSVGFRCGSTQNPADFFLDILSDETSAEKLAEIQPVVAGVSGGIVEPSDVSQNRRPATPDKPESRKWKTGFLRQFRTLLERSLKQAVRWIVHPFQLAECLIIGLFLGCLFYQLPRAEEALRSRDGLIAQLIIRNGFRALATTLDLYPLQLEMLTKERFARLYRLSAYFLATMSTDLLLWGTLPSVQIAIAYWMAGLWADAGTFLAFLGIYLFENLAVQSLMMLVVVLLGRVRGGAFGNTAIYFFTAASGFFTVASRFWSGGIKYFSLFYYVYGGMVGLEVGDGPNITCTSPSVSRVPTCHKNGVTSFEGKFYVQSLDLIQSVWVNVTGILVILILCRAAVYVALRHSRQPHLAY